jgi:hypothetical protein
MNQLIQSKYRAMFIVSAAALVCFGLMPKVHSTGKILLARANSFAPAFS